MNKRFRISFDAITPFGDAVVLFPGGRYRPLPPPLKPREEWWHRTSRETDDAESARSQARKLLEWERSGEQPIRNVQIEFMWAEWTPADMDEFIRGFGEGRS